MVKTSTPVRPVPPRELKLEDVVKLSGYRVASDRTSTSPLSYRPESGDLLVRDESKDKSSTLVTW